MNVASSRAMASVMRIVAMLYFTGTVALLPSAGHSVTYLKNENEDVKPNFSSPNDEYPKESQYSSTQLFDFFY